MMRLATAVNTPTHPHHIPYPFPSRHPMIHNHVFPSTISHPQLVIPSHLIPVSHHPRVPSDPFCIHLPIPGAINKVWHHNLKKEFTKIHNLLFLARKIDPNIYNDCFLASIDTEYPGVVSPSDKGRLQDPLYNYQQMKKNVNATKIIQLGLTLSDRFGNFYTWEFNFSDFDIETDDHNSASVELLKNHGIDFERNKMHGIPSSEFARLCRRSGLVGNNVPLTWVGFQSSYDFGYLIKILSGNDLPDDMEEFKSDLKMCFGSSLFDIKHMISSLGLELYGGLEKVADVLGVSRTSGNSHTAGSDSLLTLQTFIQLVHASLESTTTSCSVIDTLQKFTKNLNFVNAMPYSNAIAYLKILIREEEQIERKNYLKLNRCHGIKGLGSVNNFVLVDFD